LALFKREKVSLGKHLISMIRSYNKILDTKLDEPHYPYLQMAEESMAIHIGNNGRWLTLEYEIGGSLLSTHNLDSRIDNILAFNVASDCLEFLYKDMKAPKIDHEGNEKYKIVYQLPKGYDLLPKDSPFLFDISLLVQLSRTSGMRFLGDISINEDKNR
jgi:hypothetical protein